MSYQVLARKWRPKSFKAMVGQNHVLQALINALDHGRLHHAYLFTGTRGVGKTTIARILAKCLNCEVGVSSEPCGECSACQEIDQGRFVDLLEVDAASRTKVEDTRELLDNVQYAPTRGRFKVYLIDEVHMLSAHSFNALLKTLEEPPPHVKFLLATTDPQKLPVTILSRCLQFGLKNMSPERIVEYLAQVLDAEQLGYEPAALWQLGRAADGSMRDALSLTDQAIAFGNGQVTETKVTAMLGTIDQKQVYRVVAALASQQPVTVLEAVAHLAEFSPDYASVLADMLSVFHRLALAQMVPDGVDNSQGDQQQVLALAASMTAEDVQLFYQIGLQGRQDLAMAPDPRSGFEMVLLRMLAFRPQQGPVVTPKQPLPGANEPPSEEGSSSAENNGEHQLQSNSDTQPPTGTSTRGTEANSATSTANVDTHKPITEVPKPHSPAVSPEPSVASVTENNNGSMLAVENKGSATPEAGSYQTPTVADVNEAAAEMAAYQQYADMASASSGYQTVDTYALPAEDTVTIAVEEPGTVEQVASENTAIDRLRLAGAAIEHSSTVTEALTVEPVIGNLAESVPDQPLPVDEQQSFTLTTVKPADWPQLYSQLSINGAANAIAQQLELVEITVGHWYFRIAKKNTSLLNDSQIQRVSKALSSYFATEIQVSLDQVDETKAETPASYRQRKKEERLAAAKQSIVTDPNVQALIQHFSATIVESSVMPIDP